MTALDEPLAAGTLEEVAATPGSFTGEYLLSHLPRARPKRRKRRA